jgi:glucose/arabinose dehydrogenase
VARCSVYEIPKRRTFEAEARPELDMKRLLLALAAGAVLAPAALAQAAPKPTPEQLARTYEEDELSLEKCGVPRNAADDYRPTPLLPDQTRAPRIKSTQDYNVDVVASGLPNAWALAFLPSGEMLVTIRGDGLRLISADGKTSNPVAGTPAIKNAIRLFGMHDVILDHDFASNRTLYLAYVTTPEGKPMTGSIVRAKLSADGKSLEDYTVLKEGPGMIPRRIVQAPDSTLFIQTADIITPYVSVQNLGSPQGKVLRINTNGTIPGANPFVPTKGADPSVYALGIRDPQGMTLHPTTGELWLIENEPRGGDELNLVQAGRNYGFPLISYGRDNDGKLLNGGLTQKAGLEQPIYFWTPSVALSGMTIYDGAAFPGWRGDVFAGGLSGMQLIRLDMQNGRVVGEEKMLRDKCKRIRDVRQGPDGLLYVLTDEANGEIWKISPK